MAGLVWREGIVAEEYVESFSGEVVDGVCEGLSSGECLVDEGQHYGGHAQSDAFINDVEGVVVTDTCR